MIEIRFRPQLSGLLALYLLALAGCSGSASSVTPRTQLDAERSGGLDSSADPSPASPSTALKGPSPAVQSANPGSTKPSISESSFRPRPDAASGQMRVGLRPNPLSPQFRKFRADAVPSFVVETGADDRCLMTQSTTGGGGWIDFDVDGWIDYYLVQGGNPTAGPTDEQPSDLLGRNVLGQRLIDVTASAGLVEREFGQGLAVGDYDADGFPDLLVTNVGPVVLLHNEGDGTFRDVSSEAGIEVRFWGSSAAWADLDQDQLLDAYVCSYVEYDVHNPLPCHAPDGRLAICFPEVMVSADDACLRNSGDGRFRDVAKEWGMIGPGSKSLGVVIADLVGDRRPEIYVANDVCANFLWVEDKPGRWADQGIELGCALSGSGAYQASMGIVAGDYDRDGRLDLFLTHFTSEYNTLYANLGDVGFLDVTESVGLAKPSVPMLGFGTWMADFNHDGAMDIFVANGHIDDWSSKGQPFQMPAQLFSYRGPDFVEQSLQAGDYFQERHLGRAVSAADFDHDGDVDLLVVNQREQPVVLQNEAIAGHHLRLRLIGRRSNRDAIGARVSVTAGDTRLVQQRIGGGSYLAAHEPQLTFGLGAETGPCRVEILWPSGEQTIVPDLAVDREWVIVEPLATQSALVIAAE